MKNKKILTAFSCFAFSMAGLVQAATYEVTNNAASGNGTLRWAISEANANMVLISLTYQPLSTIKTRFVLMQALEALGNRLKIPLK